MLRYSACLSLCLMLLIIVFGCSSHDKSTVTEPQILPDFTDSVAADEENSTHSLLGIWTFEFDIKNLNAKVSPDRNLNSHLNVTTIIPPPNINVNSFNPVTNVIDVDVMLTNPFIVDGYDVRLIIFADDAGHQLLNPDHWTPLYDIPGGEDINPFKAYAKSDPNRIFPAQTQLTENVLVYLPGGNINVRFAVDASYPNNCVEPCEIASFTQDLLYSTPGSDALISVYVFDWQQDTNNVYLECPEITNEPQTTFSQITGTRWEANLVNNTGANAGVYPALIGAGSESSGALILYEKVEILVSTPPKIYSTHFLPIYQDDTWHDIAVSPDSFVYVVADHPETQNTDMNRTCLKFNNDLTGMTVIRPYEGLADIWDHGFDVPFNRCDSDSNDLLGINPQQAGFAVFKIYGDSAGDMLKDCFAVSCGTWVYGVAGMADIWDQDCAEYGQVIAGYEQILDCGTIYDSSIFWNESMFEFNFAHTAWGPIYDFESVVSVDGIDGSVNCLFFCSSETLGYLSISGNWFKNSASTVEIIKSGSYGKDDGQFSGGLDAAIDSDGFIITLEDHSADVFRFQKFDSDLNWLYSSYWSGNDDPMRIDFDKGDNHLYMLTNTGIHILMVQ